MSVCANLAKLIGYTGPRYHPIFRTSRFILAGAVYSSDYEYASFACGNWFQGKLAHRGQGAEARYHRSSRSVFSGGGGQEKGMRTTLRSKFCRVLAGAALAAMPVALCATDAWAQAPAPTDAPPPAAHGTPATIGEEWVFNTSATRVGDARPWLGETADARWWIGPEYLLWYIRKEHQPGPLVTTGNPNSPTAGVPGDVTTTTLYGFRDIRFGIMNGGRLTAGYQPEELPVSFEVSVFALEQKQLAFSAHSDALGNPLIAIPVNLFGTGLTAVAVSNPNLFSGGVQINTASSLWGGEVNGVRRELVDSQKAFSYLVGFRYLDLEESFHIATSSVDLGTFTPFSAFDSYGTRNHFFGGQVGAAYAVRCDRLSINVFDKLALGVNEEQINISGQRTGTSSPFPGLTSAGFLTTPSAVSGIFTSPSNVGTFSRSRFAVVDEVGINGTFEICDYLAATAGASFLFWSDVARPGNQINQIVAPGGVTPPANAVMPGPLNKETNFWAWGFNFGLEFRR